MFVSIVDVTTKLEIDSSIYSVAIVEAIAPKSATLHNKPIEILTENIGAADLFFCYDNTGEYLDFLILVNNRLFYFKVLKQFN
jgi:hypothetical protein